MNASGVCDNIQLGFLTYVQLPSGGSVGGLLIVDHRARPIEFHCSAPVTPSRTQEILYGRTLQPTLFCDQIGKSLIEQVGKPPCLILTDEPIAMALRRLVSVPLALFVNEPGGFDETIEVDRENWLYELGDVALTVAQDSEADRRVVQDTLQQMDGAWDLTEPIERIREAVGEAQRAAA